MFGGLSTVVMECGRPAGWLGDNPAFSCKNEESQMRPFFTGDGSDGIQKRRFFAQQVSDERPSCTLSLGVSKTSETAGVSSGSAVFRC
jgi:hypothetical protein